MNHEQCGQLLGDLSAYLDGEASDELCLQIERHLGDCENCRVVVDTLRKTVELVRDQPELGLPGAGLPDAGLPEDVRERLYISLDLSDVMQPRK